MGQTGDADCQHLAIHLSATVPASNKTHPIQAAENTWTRGLIERLSGYFTGSVSEDKTLFMQGNFYTLKILLGVINILFVT